MSDPDFNVFEVSLHAAPTFEVSLHDPPVFEAVDNRDHITAQGYGQQEYGTTAYGSP